MDDFSKRIDKMGAAIAPYAKARSERVYIENFLRSKKAILMQSAGSKAKTVSEREGYAYSHPEYIELLAGLKSAVEIEEKTRWALEKFKIEFSHWQTCCANDRWMKDRI